jgi:lactoylglutathione lyase
MKFNHVTLSVKNLEDSLKFYQEVVGLEVTRRFQAGPDTEIVFVGSGDTEVELICNKTAGQGEIKPGNGISMGFMSPSIDDTIKLLREKGYKTDGVIISPNPNTRFFFAFDPDGFQVQFLQA